MKKLFDKHREYMRLLLGASAALINAAAYFTAARLFLLGTTESAAAALIVAAIFIYLIRIIRSRDSKVNSTAADEISFFARLVLTGFLDIGITYYFIDILGFEKEIFIKILSGALSAAASYIVVKYFCGALTREIIGGDNFCRGGKATGVVVRLTEPALIALVLITSFAIFFYTDFSDTLDNGVLLAESVVKGSFKDYYHYAAENAHRMSEYSANYNVFLYGIFTIWNLPAVIAHISNGFNYMGSLGALLWCKALILAAVFASSVVLRKITSLYTDRYAARLSQILFLAGSCVVIPSMVTVQYDVISIFLMLCGVYFYLLGKNGAFILFFALAVPLKLFALFAIIPLVLLREKRVPMIILKIAPAFAVNFICSLPFRGDPWYELCLETQNRDAVELILNGGVSIGGYGFNLFIAAYLAVCVVCYIIGGEPRGRRKAATLYFSAEKKSVDEKIAVEAESPEGLTHLSTDRDNNCYVPLYAVFAVFAAFASFISIRSYWIILIVPFEICIAFFNRKTLRANILLLTVGNACYTLYSYMSHWILSTSKLTTELALPRIMLLPETERKYESIADMLEQADVIKYQGLLRTLFTASLILLLIINFPKRDGIRKWRGEEFVRESWYGLLQVCVTCALVGILLYANLATVSPAVINLANGGTYMEADIISGDVLRQSFKAEKDANVTELLFYAKNTNDYRSLRCAAEFVLSDDLSGEILYRGLVGTSLIKSDSQYSLDIGDIRVIAGREYTLTISSNIAGKRKNLKLHFERTENLELYEYTLEINGEKQNYNLAFTLR